MITRFFHQSIHVKYSAMVACHKHVWWLNHRHFSKFPLQISVPKMILKLVKHEWSRHWFLVVTRWWRGSFKNKTVNMNYSLKGCHDLSSKTHPTTQREIKVSKLDGRVRRNRKCFFFFRWKQIMTKPMRKIESKGKI